MHKKSGANKINGGVCHKKWEKPLTNTAFCIKIYECVRRCDKFVSCGNNTQ